MKYNIKEVKYGKNKVMYVPVFADASLKILEEFLMTEVKSFKKQIMEIIDKGEDVEFAGNVCLMHIKNDIVKIECTLDDVEIGAPVEISFQDFAQIVHDWISDTQK